MSYGFATVSVVFLLDVTVRKNFSRFETSCMRLRRGCTQNETQNSCTAYLQNFDKKANLREN